LAREAGLRRSEINAAGGEIGKKSEQILKLKAVIK
jgi:hypothetical protein